MKQQITPEQLNELDKKQILVLRKWTNATEGALPPLLSIGQMMEYLGWEERPEEMNDFVLNFIDFRGMGEQNKFCDGLWEAVKEELNK